MKHQPYKNQAAGRIASVHTRVGWPQYPQKYQRLRRLDVFASPASFSRSRLAFLASFLAAELLLRLFTLLFPCSS